MGFAIEFSLSNYINKLFPLLLPRAFAKYCLSHVLLLNFLLTCNLVLIILDIMLDLIYKLFKFF